MIPAITPRPRTGGDAVLEALEREGVDVIFGYPGGTIMPFYDAMFGDPDFRHYLVRHEAAAVFAASGYARTTGRVGLCCATSGPGATNLVTGLLDAFMDSVPLVAITGQVRSVDVHRLLAEDTVDQPMLEILATKAVLFDEYVRRSELKD